LIYWTSMIKMHSEVWNQNLIQWKLPTNTLDSFDISEHVNWYGELLHPYCRWIFIFSQKWTKCMQKDFVYSYKMLLYIMIMLCQNFLSDLQEPKYWYFHYGYKEKKIHNLDYTPFQSWFYYSNATAITSRFLNDIRLYN
jgi:hypothetical protein